MVNQTKKEYSPIKITLIISVLLIITATSYFFISKSRLGGLNIGFNKNEGNNNPETLENKYSEPEDQEEARYIKNPNLENSTNNNSLLTERQKGYDCYKMTQYTQDTDNDGYFELVRNPGYYFGDIVSEVKRIEKKLNFTYPDNEFARNTKTAVENFQTRNGLPVTGAVGIDTARKLGIAKISNRYRLLNTENNQHKHQGAKNTLNVIQTFTNSWEYGPYGNKIIYIGDINAPGHITHDRGLSFDVYSPSNIFRIKTIINRTDSNGNDILESATNNSYSRRHAIFLGKKIAKTKAIDYIIYGDPEVNDAVNRYVVDNNLGRSNLMQLPSSNANAHNDHFHVQVKENTSCRNW